MSYYLQGKNILITGAAMGMGKIYAQRAVQEKAANIILLDINQVVLEQTAEELRGKGSNIFTEIVDLSKLEEINRVIETIKALGAPGKIDVLINNAGVVMGSKYFWECDDIKDTYFTMSINALAPMYITKGFIDEMIADKSKEKRILNVASAAGLVANPRMSVYAASKWAAIGWSDSLRLELEKTGNTHIKVSTFCPSYISTGMFDGAKGMLFTPIITPDNAVDAAWNGMKKGVPIIYKPKTTKISIIGRGLLPARAWDWLAAKVFKIYSSMDDFKGHQS